ncbi:unnamed protein product, partial [marine sediment metagenome]
MVEQKKDRITKTTEPLTKKEIDTIWRRFYNAYGVAGSFDALSGPNFLWGLEPLFDKYYDNDKKCEELLKHYKFFNTENIFGSVIYGIVTAMEEAKALGKDVDDELIQSTKTSLMGPMAGIGDALNPGLIVPLLLSIAITLSTGGSILGAVFYIIVYNLVVILISKVLFYSGYRLGLDSIQTLIGEASNKIRDSFLLLGTTIMGGIAASYVGINLLVTYPSGNDQVSLQGLLDGIFPKLLPLLLVLGCWQLMAKKN